LWHLLLHIVDYCNIVSSSPTNMMNEQQRIQDENPISCQYLSSSLTHNPQVPPPSPGPTGSSSSTASVKQLSYADGDGDGDGDVGALLLDSDLSVEQRRVDDKGEEEVNANDHGDKHEQQRRLVQVEAPRFLHALTSSTVSSSSGTNLNTTTNALVQDSHPTLDGVPALENLSDDSTSTGLPSSHTLPGQQPTVVCCTDDNDNDDNSYNNNINDPSCSSSGMLFECGYDARAWRQHLKTCLENHSRDHREQAALLLSTFHQLRLRRNEESVEARQELLLLTGPLGSGKTRLAKTLQKPVCEGLGGYFLTGKFDRLQRPAPYTAFVSAFAEFTNMVLSRGETEIARMRKAIRQEVGDEFGVLTRIIPSLKQICGECPCSYVNNEAKADDALQRFVFVFRNFLRAISCSEHPVVLFFDNIHWAVSA
jgi:AAA ATPase domain